MRFTKPEILETFDREDRSYRIALLCSNWIRDTARYKPSAVDDARGLQMEANGKWISFADIADKLQLPTEREVVSSDFVLSHLHALIRVPFELLSDYCEDYEAEFPTRGLLGELKGSDWYWFARMIRNAVSHNFHFDFTDRDRRRLPLKWNGIVLTTEMDGKPLTFEAFWHRSGYELFLQMRKFAEALPDPLVPDWG